MLAHSGKFLYNRQAMNANKNGDVPVMKKKSLLALILAASLLLSGCALITTDEKADNAQVIVDVNGETVDKATIKAEVEYEIQNNQQMNSYYSMFGMEAGLPTDEATLTPEVIDNYVELLVAQQKARELGMDQLTDEEKAEVDADAQEQYDGLIEQVIAYYFADAGELTEEEIREQAIALAVENGATVESYAESVAQNKALEKLQAETVKDVAVTDEDLQTALEANAESDKEYYAEDPSGYCSAVNNGTAMYYAPAGCRMVKQILVKFTEDDSVTVTNANTALTAARNGLTNAENALTNAAEDADLEALQTAVTEAQAALEAAQADFDAVTAAAQANIQDKVQEVYAAATAEGADFDALIEQYNEDTGMPAQGYALCEGYTDFVESFTAAGMALEKVGDVSEPAPSTYGYHILQYTGDVAEGTAALEDVRQVLTADVLSAKQSQCFADALAAWKAEANVKTYPEKMN